MSRWSAKKATRVLAALKRIGWYETRVTGSHRTLERQGWAPCSFSFHDNEEIGPRMLAKISKETGLQPEDL